MTSVGTDSARILTSEIVGGMVPANAQWFELDGGTDETDEEQRWLSQSARVLWENINLGNFDAVAYECCLDLVDAGWFVMYVDRAKNGGFIFQQWPLSECFIACSEAGGHVDIVGRNFKYTIEQAVNAYGLENLSLEVKTKYAEGKGDHIIELTHFIEPRKEYMEGAKLAKNMPIASIITECKTKHIIEEKGYNELPVIVPRWMLLLDTPYGIGPMFEALPDLKSIDEIKRMELSSLDLAIAGMWIAKDDGVLNTASIKVGPRKVIVANSTDSMKPLVSGVNFDVAFSSEERLEASVRKLMMADQLQPQSDQTKTAYEISVRVGMIRKLMGPLYGRMQSEWLKVMVERCFGIAYPDGVFGEPPKSLLNRNFSVRYTSPLARAQKMQDVNAIEPIYRQAMQMSQAKGGDPSPFDKLNDDIALEFSAEAMGVPDKIMRSADDAAASRKARSESQEQAKQQEQQAQLAQKVIPGAVNQAAMA